MTTTRFNRLCRALVLMAALLEFSVGAQTFIITNAAPKAIPRRAGIIFIQVDGLGFGDLSCYGQTNFQTPNLDKLAAEGIRFTNYFVADTGFASHAALMLGKNPDHFGALETDETTVAQLLQNSGYHTGLIGQWDLGDEKSGAAPWEKGFDEFAGYFDANDSDNFYADYMFRYTRDEWINPTNNRLETYSGHEMIYANTQGKNEYIPDVLTKAALNFIQNNQPDPFNHYQPFFLLVNYKIPGEKIEVPTAAPFSEESWPQPAKNRAALILRIDGYIGRMQEQLQISGMTNNVAIFFSSASVPIKTAGADLGFFYGNMSTNDFRAPMIAWWPEKFPAARVGDYQWSARDFLPTAAEIAFANEPTNIDGISAFPALLGPANK
jgi:arylsulfatase A-like enzyme